MPGLSYESSGVRYGALDAFKRLCQREAATTVAALASHQLSEPANIRGESAYLIETPASYLAHVEEGLGTKNLVADCVLKLTGKSFYASIGIDTVATMVNDLITTGALPISIAMHAAVGDSSWFEERQRSEDLARGFAQGCRISNAVWAGGETPALKGIVNNDTIVLAGSAIGTIFPKSNRIAGNIADGDAILFLASSGVQTNGLTLCRALADKLPSGYLTDLPDGRTYGETLLDPSIIYVRFIQACQHAKIPIHYAVHVTGHGWRKLMRAPDPFVYRITTLRPPLPIFHFIQTQGQVDQREMYATFNMGVGFAIYLDPTQAQSALKLAQETGYDAYLAGTVMRAGSRKAVEIAPLDITFQADTLAVR